MKKTIIAILALTIFLPLFAFSQGVYDEEEVTPALYIGPYFGWTLAGINASEVPNGTKNIVATAPTPNLEFSEIILELYSKLRYRVGCFSKYP